MANFEESVDKNGSVVTNYAYEQNIHSDSQFLKEHLEQMEKQENTVTVVTDGAYRGIKNNALANEKNVNLILPALQAERQQISWQILNSMKMEPK